MIATASRENSQPQIISISVIGTAIFGLGSNGLIYKYGSVPGEWIKL